MTNNNCPMVALIGRPNVGKSTLFNRITKSRKALVDSTPGVTRDRHYDRVTWNQRSFILVDTGGIDDNPEDLLVHHIREQAMAAIEEADIILFLMDGRQGVTPADYEVVEILRRTEKPIFHVVNKIDSPKQEIELLSQFYELGIEELWPLSAEHTYGFQGLMDGLCDKISVEEVDLSLPEDTVKVAFFGRPNVGKSTLLNNILGMKLSITSRKPQTTRHQILGVKTTGDIQAVYVDTPGIHQRRGTAINKYMNRAATSVLNDVDVILFVVQVKQWTEEDQAIVEKLASVECPVLLVLNKMDKLSSKKELLPLISELSSHYDFTEIVPVSAMNGMNVDALEKKVLTLLPENDHFYADDQVTDRSMRFLASEIIREKLIRELGQELPYTSTVDIDKYIEDPDIVRIHATIYVESAGQKAIIIGKKGARLKSIGTAARQDISKMVDSKVYINLWVKVREGWSNDERALRGLGYSE